MRQFFEDIDEGEVGGDFAFNNYLILDFFAAKTPFDHGI